MNFEKPENQLTRGNQRTFFGRSFPQSDRAVKSRARRVCKNCSKPHEVWVCRDFKQWDIPKSGNVLKSLSCVFVV